MLLAVCHQRDGALSEFSSPTGPCAILLRATTPDAVTPTSIRASSLSTGRRKPALRIRNARFIEDV